MPATRALKRRLLDGEDTKDHLTPDCEQDDKRRKESQYRFRNSLAQYHFTDPSSPSPLPPTPPASSPTKSPRRRPLQGYAPPSTYAHLPLLHDVLTPNLIVAFIGTNPGIKTATSGHAYAHPSNLFWKLLHSSGCTSRRLSPTEDIHLPQLFAMGNTNLVSRPTRDAGQLSKTEMSAGTPILEAKIAKFQPEAVCVVGKGIWEAIVRWRTGRVPRKDEFKYGWQDVRMGKTDDWEGARVFVTTSTSGLSAGLRPHEKEAIWRPFGEWVAARRQERLDNGTENPIYTRETRVVNDT